MNKKVKGLIACIAGLSLILGLTSVASANQPKKATPKATSSGGWFAVAPLSGDVFIPSDSKSHSVVSPKLLQPDDWSKCWIEHDATWKIDVFATKYLGVRKQMSIQCGTAETHGYLHIALGKSGHQKGWRDRVYEANPGSNTDSWDDLMWFSAKSTWTSPELSVEQGSGKVCRSGPVQMFQTRPDGSKVLKFTFRPTFIWSITSNRLITAIETTVPSC